MSVHVCVCLFHTVRLWEVIRSISLDEEAERGAVLLVYTLVGSFSLGQRMQLVRWKTRKVGGASGSVLANKANGSVSQLQRWPTRLMTVFANSGNGTLSQLC